MFKINPDFCYDNPLSFYFDASNFPNQELMNECYSFLESALYINELERPKFLNAVWFQCALIMNSHSFPDTFSIYFDKLQMDIRHQHSMLGFVLKWFGGYPCGSHMGKYEAALKIVEEKFLSLYPNESTPEKDFCLIDQNHPHDIMHVSAGQPADTMRPIQKGSSFAHRIAINFGDLPKFIIQKAIYGRFEYSRLLDIESYSKWRYEYMEFLKTIPKQYRLATIKKGIEYGGKVLKYHQASCRNSGLCPLEESLTRRITIAEDLLEKSLLSNEDDISEQQSSSITSKEFTLARQVLATNYLLDYAGVKNVDITAKAKFIQFLTGKQLGAKSIHNTEIYKKLRNPFPANEAALTKDLQFIRNYFEELGLTPIVVKINKELGSKE